MLIILSYMAIKNLLRWTRIGNKKWCLITRKVEMSRQNQRIMLETWNQLKKKWSKTRQMLKQWVLMTNMKVSNLKISMMMIRPNKIWLKSMKRLMWSLDRWTYMTMISIKVHFLSFQMHNQRCSHRMLCDWVTHLKFRSAKFNGLSTKI